jgi:Ca2+-binding RTX toxin-like protein
VDAYLGPVDHLRWQFLGDASAEVLPGTGDNDFINALGGDDAVAGLAGRDVIDGGTGSNFLAGGEDTDVFFLDGRGGQTTWSTIVDWKAGEQLAVWGWRPDVSQALWVEEAGTIGFRGVTMHADMDGNGQIDTSVTWAGMSRADLPVPVQMDGLLWFA